MHNIHEYLWDNVTLIGLSGTAGSGKDYIAKNYFVEKHGFLNIALASHFKIEALAQGLGTYDEIFNTKPPKIRTLLQIMGTELGRWRYGNDWWTNITLSWIAHFHKEWGHNRWIITDVRFPNEAMGIIASGGDVYRVISDKQGRELEDRQKKHPSETSLSDDSSLFNGTIFNKTQFPRRYEIELLSDTIKDAISAAEDRKQEYDWEEWKSSKE